MKIKTIDITAKEWYDKLNGNSYFSALIVINYGMKTAKSISLPFQYGYGNHYEDMAFKALQEQKIIPKGESSYSRYYEENRIVYRNAKHENCLKREVIAFAA